MVGVGIWAFIEKNKYYQKDILTLYDVVSDMSIILMVLGIIIFLIGSAGCVGALRENVCLLKVVSNIKLYHAHLDYSYHYGTVSAAKKTYFNI